MMNRVHMAEPLQAAADETLVGFRTVRTYQADNLFSEIEDDPRIPENWKPRLKKVSKLAEARSLSAPDERLCGAVVDLIRKQPIKAKPSVASEIAELPYLTMRCKLRTEAGDVPAHSLKPGDKVLTRDNGYQPVTWVGVRKIHAADLDNEEALKLIHVEPGALAENMPKTDVWVTPAQAFLMTPASHWKGIGVSEMLVRAADLVTLPGVNEKETRKVGLVQVLLDSHEVIMVNGAWTGSLRPDPDRLAAFPKAHRKTLCNKFPDLVDEIPSRPFPSARVELKPQTALYLMDT